MHRSALITAASLSALVGGSPAQAAASMCERQSGAGITALVELYTSEGCNSCPPADRWLSSLKGQDGVIALAFHVDYWDRLGWKDRFASAAHTERQYQIQRHTGARFVYTPQVVLNGADWRGWSGAAPASPGPARIDLHLRRDGDMVEARVTPRAGASGKLAGYWAATEDDHKNAVAAGENRGVTLLHDHVVRSYTTTAAWPASQPQTLRHSSPVAGEDGRARRVVLVVYDADNGRPVQALSLGC